MVFLALEKQHFLLIFLPNLKRKIPVCAIVNDMSELDVDGELIGNTELVESNRNILESINSCVLSSKKGIKKLDQALKNFYQIKSQSLLSLKHLEVVIQCPW